MVYELINKLYENEQLEKKELKELLETLNEESKEYLFEKANEKRTKVYGNKVYMRGLIEFSNYCSKDCLYCGIRKSNKKVVK